MTPEVSIVMPVYNGLPYLKEAIESILSQTLKDFEFFILIDGPQGNRDGSLECAQSYATRDSRIRVIMNEDNLGTARTMNKGIELASAPIVARLDQDDISYPRRLEVQLTYLKAHPELTIVSTWEYRIDTKTRKVRNCKADITNYGAFIAPLILGLCPIWHPSIMFYKEAMIVAGGYREQYQPVEDFEVTMRLGYSGYRGGVVPEYLVGQRHHGARQSVTKLGAQIKMREQVHQEMIKVFLQALDSEIEQLSKFLGLNPSFWRDCTSKNNFYQVCDLMVRLFEAIRVKLNLTSEEFNTMREMIYARLGYGTRYVRQLRHIPAAIFFPVFFAISPFLLPRLRSIAWTVHELGQELRYPWRLLQSGLERRV